MYTTWFLRNIRPMSRAYKSIPTLRTINFALNPTSGAYLVNPYCRTSLIFTVLKKYQFNPASTIRISTFSILSQTLLMLTNVWLTGGTVCAGIQIQKTAILIAVIMATVPHFILRTVLRYSAIRAIRFIMICMRS